MLPRLDAAIVTPVKPADGAGAGVAIGDGRQAAFQRAVQSLVGQTVPAEVLSKLKDGSYLVKVAENSVRLMLPGDTQVGTSVPLTVLTAQPRPTFQLGTSTPGAAPTLLYTDAGAAEGGEAATLPSQGAVVLPGSGKPASGAAQGAPGQPGAPTTGAGAGAGAPADADAAPGQLQPGLPGTPASGAGATAGNPAANSGNSAATGRPGLPAGAAPDTPDAPAGNAAQAGRPAIAAGNAALPNPAAALATPAGAAQAQAAATLAAGSAGSAVPADAVKPQSLAATLLGKAPLTPASELPELSANTPQATLSSAARVLTTVLSTAQAGQAAQAALIGKTALFGNAAPDTDALAQQLHETISKSGLFYESHVAEWVKGERPLAELMREPQMQRLLQQQGGETAARAAAGGPDLSAAQMINQQLHTQEQNRVLWHGQAWPGQEMQWDVRREQREGGQGGNGDADGEPEQIWRSGVRFRLPLLGAVSAAVTLVGEQVHIQVQTDSDGSAVTLRAYASQLESAMAAAGAQLSSLTISQEDDHG
ncbi:hook-length control protein FliK [Duganella sp. CF402]|uniref:flagellar hook-length control protein FliK n=1 Tax=unclassified Duganella TaxID=2636909 RepID=UPI0008AAC756|nr:MULTISPECIES: flagellar hook-length control protein FliK [unclassified Duganella]RZT09029.1 flagellar hook-length control protein FliK [Duganella sp. BK701]SEL73071.1 hook-length control protein FliK [Duganella sp. CF402]